MLDNIKKVHFIGIGGVSMNALALCLKSMGRTVTGSDRTATGTTDMLTEQGIPVHIGHAADNIGDAQLVVYNAAIDETNPELSFAIKSGIETLERPELLGLLMEKYKLPIGIAGTHGKTTVTSMIAAVMMEAETDPTVMVGGNFSMISGTLRLGRGDPFIFEACEYCNSFLNFAPFLSVINNIEADHLDFFRDIDDIINSFQKYIGKTLPGGTVIVNAEDENVIKAVRNANCQIITFGIKKGDFTAGNIKMNSGLPSFDLLQDGKILGRVELSVDGKHNVKNALAAAACAHAAGVPFDKIRDGLVKFKGTSRRFEFIKEINGIKIFDDYAHHPTEVRATVETAKSCFGGKVTVVFQPHTYTRTKEMHEDFARQLSAADYVILAPIYAAREKSIEGVTSKMISDKIDGALYIEDFSDIADRVLEIAKPGDIAITMGAGDINKVIDFL